MLVISLFFGSMVVFATIVGRQSMPGATWLPQILGRVLSVWSEISFDLRGVQNHTNENAVLLHGLEQSTTAVAAFDAISIQ